MNSLIKYFLENRIIIGQKMKDCGISLLYFAILLFITGIIIDIYINLFRYD